MGNIRLLKYTQISFQRTGSSNENRTHIQGKTNGLTLPRTKI